MKQSNKMFIFGFIFLLFGIVLSYLLYFYVGPFFFELRLEADRLYYEEGIGSGGSPFHTFPILILATFVICFLGISFRLFRDSINGNYEEELEQ